MKAWLIAWAVFLQLAIGLSAQTPAWIWHRETNSPTVFFRKTFRTPPLTWNARLTLAADDSAEVFLNGVPVGRCADWQHPLRGELSVRLNQGENVIAVRAENREGRAGLLVHFSLNGQTNLLSDATWLASPREEANWTTLGFNAADWSYAVSLAAHGSAPWGDVLFRAGATPAENLQVLPGFQVELIRSAAPDEGSWICLTVDNRGRLIISPQGDERPLLRVTLYEGKVAKVEPMPLPIHYAMGMLYAFDSFYANARGPQGPGLYRAIDANQNDQFETNEVRLLKAFKGDSEHGYHGLALGPDQKIYVLNGNGTKLPKDLAPDSPYQHYAEDRLTGGRRPEDDQEGSKVPNCHILQTDADGREWRLWAGGLRNAYDLDFNEAGELFTFDSDMEWDWGTPWYRPCRILHLVSGGEYGWRDGTRMFAGETDSLPEVVNIGIGSPTGVKFGARSHFPPLYRQALYVMDWSYGRILAVHLMPWGGGYVVDPNRPWENFVRGTPLNLTSLAFGPDGAMYFITGGRGTQSGLYRVSFRGEGYNKARPLSAPDVRMVNPDPAYTPQVARALRHQLEELHGQTKPEALPFILENLRSARDRDVAFAARIALESQPVDSWTNVGSLAASLARSRVAPGGTLFETFRSTPIGTLLLLQLRQIEIALARAGPELKFHEEQIADLNASYPSDEPHRNQQLSRILLFLNAPGAVSKTIKLLQSAPTQEEQMHYVEQLRNVRQGWTLEDRQIFFGWFLKPRDPKAHPAELLKYFEDVGRSYVDGAWFDKYLRDFRRQAIATLTPEERRPLEPLLALPIAPAQTLPARHRAFVRNWKMEDLLPELERSRKPDLARGRQVLVDAQCLSCHRFGNDGGVVGPELTGAGSKYSARDLLESIIEPSRVLSDQYQNQIATLKNGESLSGRVVSDSAQDIVLETDRLSGLTEKINRHDLLELRPSPISPMPEGLVNVLTREEILDLVAYLRAGVKFQQGD